MSSQVIVAVVRDGLTQSASVTNLVSTRIFTAFRDTTTLPAIVLSTGQDANVSPTFGRTDCLRKFTVDVDCIASTLKVSRQIAEAVRAKMHGAAGTSRGVSILEMREVGITSQYDVGAEATETGIHVTTVTLEATYRSSSVSPTTITEGSGGVP
jgi:hypothetical protein